MIRILHIARYTNPMMERKINLMAEEGIAFLRVRPSNSSRPDRDCRVEVDSRKSRYTRTPLLGRFDDPHRALYRTLTFGMASFRPHIIHAEEEPDSLSGLQISLAKRLFAPRSLLVLHTWQNVDRKKKPHVRAVIAVTLGECSAVLCANRKAVEVLYGFGYRGLTEVIPPQGVDTHVFTPTEKRAGSGRFTILYAGRFVPEKGLDMLLDAVSHLTAPVRLLFIGAGSGRKSLEDGILKLPPIHQGEIMPSQSQTDMARFYREADLLVLPSRGTAVWQEQFGRVLVEAMACKVPVIGSDSGAIPEVIGPGGLIFKEGDSRNLAECITRLIESPPFREELAEKGYLRAVNTYGQEQVARQTVRFYRELLQASARRERGKLADLQATERTTAGVPAIGLSLIIVNWNTMSLLRDCLASIFKTCPESLALEVIVVDNGSSDGSGDMVRGEFPSVLLINNSDNVGFSRATNQGIKASAGRFVLLLNSDTVLLKETLANLMEFMERHDDAGVCGARLIRPDGSVQPYLFGSDPTLSYLLRRGLKRLLLGKALHDWNTREAVEVDWVSGACLMARREVLFGAGLLDENIFMYFEDNDLCLRVRHTGQKVYYNPAATVIHAGGQSLSGDKERRKAYFESLLYFYGKHYGSVARFVLKLLLFPYRLYLGVL